MQNKKKKKLFADSDDEHGELDGDERIKDDEFRPTAT